MLTRRKLTLVAGMDAEDVGLIKAERLQQHWLGLDVLAQARQQSTALIEAARQQAQDVILRTTEQAEQQFWRQADDILRGWQQERDEMEAYLASQAGQILTDAMAQLLTDVPGPQRHQALLRQLIRAQGGEGRGMLYCHPHRKADVTAWLDEHAHLGWKLNGDDTLAEDALKLVTPQGVMTLSWQQAIDQLLPKADVIPLHE
ncbi:type III secretion system stator protein SctL [Pectobacteriaceae bacterium C52]|nr:type III secretion system stator protein SctL [Pectobacteriaceae bacterium C52]